MDKPEYLGLLGTTIVKGKRRPLVSGLVPSAVDATQGIPAPSSIHNVADLIAAGALQGEQTRQEMNDFGRGVVQFAKEHPVGLTTGLIGGALLPATIPGMLAMGGLGAGSEAIDTKLRGEEINPRDLAIGAGIQGLTHGLFGRAPVEDLGGDRILRSVAQDSRRGMRGSVLPEETPQYLPAPESFGHPAGLDILNPEYYPASAVARTQELIAQGHPQWIPGPERSGLGGTTVLNPVHKFDPMTPEGIEYYKAGGVQNPTILYSAGKSTNSPYVAVKEIAGAPKQSPTSGYTATLLRNNDDGTVTTVVPKFLSTDKVPAKTYIRMDKSMPGPFQTDEATSAYRNALMDNIKSGRINENNLPTGFKSVSELEDYIYSPAQQAYSEGTSGFSSQDARRMLYEVGDPRATGTMQELISLAKNPHSIDMGGGWWTDKAMAENVSPHTWQKEQIIDAIMGGHDELRFLQQSDPGPTKYTLTPEELMNKAHTKPTDVYVGWEPGNYISPYGLGPIKREGNPLNMLPLTAGLGALLYGHSK